MLNQREIEIVQKLGFSEVIDKFRIWERDIRRVHVSFDGNEQSFPEDVRRKIEDSWNAMKSKNPAIFNGWMASVKKIRNNNGILNFDLRKSCYKDFVYLRQGNPKEVSFTKEEIDLGTTYPLSMGMICVTTDQSIILAERNWSADWAGLLNSLPSGYLDPYKSILKYGDPGEEKEKISFFFLIMEELMEETLIEEFSSIRWNSLIYGTSGNTQPLLAGTMMVPYSDRDIKDLFKKKRDEFAREVGRIHLVKNDTQSVKDFLHSMYGEDAYRFLTPHLIGQLVSHFSGNLL